MELKQIQRRFEKCECVRHTSSGTFIIVKQEPIFQQESRVEFESRVKEEPQVNEEPQIDNETQFNQPNYDYRFECIFWSTFYAYMDSCRNEFLRSCDRLRFMDILGQKMTELFTTLEQEHMS